MLDLNLFRIERGNDPEAIRISQRRRGESVEIVDEIIQLDINWRKRQYELDMLRKDLRSLTTKVASLKIDKKIDKSDSDDGVKEAEAEAREKMKNSIAKKEMEVNEAWDELYKKLIQVGNLVDSSVTVGFDEAKNPIVRTWGEPRQREPKLKNHVELVKLLGIVDTVNGSKVAGHRGYYMIGVGVRLILALVQQGISFLNSKGYSEVMTPYFMNQDVMANCAQLLDFDDELYKVSGEKDDEKYLIATAEQPLCALHCKSWMKHSELPKRYAGFSSCFRKEAGSHGKDTLGIFRTHQFEKVEQFCITDPNHSWEMLEEMMKNSEEFYQMLGLPYRTVAIVSGALNAAAAKKYDLEAWFPASGTFRELVSCSNCTDYQSRKLEIRYNGPKKGSDSTKQYVHMLNCTLIAAQRTLCCILENYQKEDGVEIPELLRPMLGGMTFLPFKS